MFVKYVTSLIKQTNIYIQFYTNFNYKIQKTVKHGRFVKNLSFGLTTGSTITVEIVPPTLDIEY